MTQRGRAVHVAAALGLVATAALAIDPATSLDAVALRHWGVAEGLPQSSANAVVQTPEGYLLVATFGGVAAFDGRVFHPLDLTALGTPRVLRLYRDRDGSVWVGSEGRGLGRLLAGGAVVRADLPVPPDVEIAEIGEDAAGNLWVATVGRGVYRFGPDGDLHLTARDGLPQRPVSSFAADADGAVWLGTRLGGIARFERGRLRVLTAAQGLPGREIMALHAASGGGVWVATDTGGLARCTASGCSAVDLGLDLRGKPVWRVLEDDSGAVWAAVYRVGLVRWRPGGRASVLADPRFEQDPVRCLVQDESGAIWLGTDAGGLFEVLDAPFRVFGEPEGMAVGRTLAVTGDGGGGVLVGLNCGGIAHVRDEHVTPLAGADGPLKGCVWSLLRDRMGRVWIGHWGPYLERLEVDGRLTRFTSKNGLAGTTVLALFESASGQVWVGTHDGGASRFEGDGTFTTFGRDDGLPSLDVRGFCDDGGGGVWIATSAGLAHFRAGAITTLDSRDGLGSNLVRALYLDRDGFLWIGTYGGGLSVLRKGRVTTFGVGEGLPEGVVSWIGEDDAGHLWLTGNRGITRVAKRDLLAVADGGATHILPAVYGREDGLRTVECAGGFQPAGWKDARGRLWFPTLAGVARVDPSRLGRGRPSRVRVDAVQVDGADVTPRDGGVRLGTKQRLSIVFSGLSLGAADKLVFRYRLRGFDHDWVYGGDPPKALYSALPPGQFVFEAMAYDPEGGWSEPSPPLRVYVPVVMWRTWWFALGLGLAIAAAVGGVARWRQHQRFRRRQERAEVMRQLSVAMLHEFRQPLQVLQSSIELLELKGGARAEESLRRSKEGLERLRRMLERLERLNISGDAGTVTYAGGDVMIGLDEDGGEDSSGRR